MVGPTSASVASAAVKSVPRVSGAPSTPVVALVSLSVMTGTTMTEAAVKEAGLSAPPKRSRITALVEKPSSALTAAWLGIRAFAGWMLRVPSVEPAKYRSVGYGNTPAAGWNSAVLEVGCSGGVEPPGLPLSTVRSGAPMVPRPPDPQPPMRNAAARTPSAMILFISPFPAGAVERSWTRQTRVRSRREQWQGATASARERAQGDLSQLRQARQRRAAPRRACTRTAHHRRHLAGQEAAFPGSGRDTADPRPRARDAVQLARRGNRGGALPRCVRRQRRARARGAARAARGMGRGQCRGGTRGRAAPPGCAARPPIRHSVPRPAICGGTAGARGSPARGCPGLRGVCGPRTPAAAAGELAAAQGEAGRRGRLSSVRARCAGSHAGRMRSNAVYPGTFDPITNGHHDLVRRAAGIFDRVIVAIAANSNKTPMFTLEKRVELARRVLQDLANVEVHGYAGLTVEFAQQYPGAVIVRGLRAVSDFEFEFQLANMSRHLDRNFETVFLTPQEQFTFISSSLVREIAVLGGDVSRFVHPIVEAELKKQRR